MRAIADPLDVWASQAHRLSGLDPRAYSRRIVAMALFGAVILHSVWVLSLLATGTFIGLALWLPSLSVALLAAPTASLAVVWLVLLLRGESFVSGVPLGPRNAPALLELISTVARELGAPNPTRVSLVADFNAWVQLRRRPWGEWHLALGLPLMLACDANQLKAIIGHELGHFVAGTPGARLVWAQQASWYSTLKLLGTSRLGVLVRGAFRSWGMRFQAESVAMARQHERSADAAGAKVAGARAAAEALILFDLYHRAMSERFWPEVWRRVSAGPPPDDVFIELRHFVTSLDRQDFDRYYRSALLAPTLTFDVHPSLTDRLANLGQKPALPAPAPVSAAVALLGAQLDTVSRDLALWWAFQVKWEWAEAQEEAKRLDKVLAENKNRSPSELHPADALEMARALRRAGRLSEALPCYRRAVHLDSGDARTRLGLGLALLETGDVTGLVELRAGVSRSGGDPRAVREAFVGARRFLEARGEPEKNPFTQEFHRVLLTHGRNAALHEWGRLAVL